MQADVKKPDTKWKKVIHYLFIALLLFMMVNTGAKAWLLRQMIAVGLFKAEIKGAGAEQPNPLAAPAFYYTGTDGRTVSTDALKGKVVFVNFWATWCPPCIAEMPSLQALYNKLKDDERFVFLFITEDDDRQVAGDYLKDKGYDLPLYTRAGTISGKLYSGTLPTTLVLDTAGRVVMKEEGLANYNTSEFIAQLKALL